MNGCRLLFSGGPDLLTASAAAFVSRRCPRLFSKPKYNRLAVIDEECLLRGRCLEGFVVDMSEVVVWMWGVVFVDI